MVIILIIVLCAIVATAAFFIIKNILLPTKADALPKLYKQGKTQHLIKSAKQIISKDSKNYLAHYYLGKAYIKENKTELAILEFKIVNENALFGTEIEEIPFRQEYASILLKCNQQGEALKNYLLLTKLEPRNAENYFNCGQIYEQQNRYDVALGFMQKAAFLDKKHAKAHAEIGLMMYRTKNSENYSAYYYLGKILKDAKDLQGAIKAFEKAQRDPEVKQKSIIEHGSCYMMANRLDNASLDFIRAVELDKNNENPETLYARYFLATCYEKMRKIDKAIEQWEAIYKQNKGFRDVGSKLSEYKDLQANDYLKDYLTCSNEEFMEICKMACEKSFKLQVLSCDLKKWGCQLTGVDKRDESWMSVRKQLLFVRFYREPEPIDDTEVRQALDEMKSLGSVKGFLFSSSGFSNTAKRFADNRPVELAEKQKLEAILAQAGA